MTPIKRRAILELGLAGLAGFFLEACAGDAATGSTMCVAGESVDCALETCSGKAICQADGSFSQCICDGGTTGMSSANASDVGTTGSGTTGAATTGTGTTGTGTTGMGTTGTGTTGTGMTGTGTTGTGTGTTGTGMTGAGGGTSTTATSAGGAAGMGTTTGAGGDMASGGAGGMGAGGTGMGGTADAGMCGAGINVSDGNGITSFHAHALMIPGADIEAGAPMTYTMTGDHTHSVSLSAAQLEQLRNGETVDVTSSNDDNHSHAVTLSC